MGKTRKLSTEQLYEDLKRVAPTDDEELWLYIRRFFGCAIPRHRIKTRRECREDGHCPPFDYVADSFFDRVDDLLVWACRTGGKTFNAAVVSVLEHAHKPNLQRRILGGSEEQSKRMYEHMEPPLLGSFGFAVDGRVEKLRTRFKNGGHVSILAASPTHVLGHHIPRLMLDEIDEFDPDVLEKALGTSVSQHGYQGRIERFSTFHNAYGVMADALDRLDPETKFYKWCIFEVMQRCAEEYSCAQCCLFEDCQGVCKRDIPEGAGYVTVRDARRWKRAHSKEGWQSFYLCMRPYGGDRFYKSFSIETHVAKSSIPYNPNLPLYRTFDVGTNDPTVCLWIQVDNRKMVGERPTVLVIDEWRERGLAHSDAVQKVLSYHGLNGYGATLGDYGDPSAAAFKKEAAKHKIFIQGARSLGLKGSENTRKEGHEIIRQFLCSGDGKSAVIFSPRCQRYKGDNIVDELIGLHYRKPAQGQPIPEDCVKLNDHGPDALRYFFRARFPLQSWQFA